jgi:glycosyltransferase involved in cell wall biosynthesis
MASKVYNWSVIIPHKNIPHLLERCLSSIPVREDVQVIVVDDASDPTIVDFARFPGLGRPNTEVIFNRTPMGQGGAGLARNVGMAEATGHWLVFADADDFFHPSLGEMMDKYVFSDADIIFFRHDSVDSETLQPVEINTRRNRILAEFDYTGDTDPLRYMIWVPWGKFLKRSMVVKGGIKFDEIMFSNNLMFSVRTGHCASKILSDRTIIYCNTRRVGSVIHEGRTDWEAMCQRFDVDYRAARYIIEVGKGRLFEEVVAERWLALGRIDPEKTRKLLPKLREVCSSGEICHTRAKLCMERIVRPFRKV